jgi:hypothetical protein
MPPDGERKERLDFGTLYAVGENTYLATDASRIRSIADVDHSGTRVIGIAGTATSAWRADPRRLIQPNWRRHRDTEEST